jgi:hypothetical protein
MTEKEQEPGLESAEQSETLGSDEISSSSWEGELPPEDDFHDEAESLAEESMPEEVEQIDIAANAKKRGTMIALSAVAGSVLLVGVLVYLQFATNGPSTPTAIPAASVMDTKADNKAAKTHDYGADQNVSPTTGEADITSIYNAGLDKTNTSQSAVAVPTGAAAPKSADKTSDETVASSEIMSMTSSVAPSAPKAVVAQLPAAQPAAAPKAAANDTAPKAASVLANPPMPALQPVAKEPAAKDLASTQPAAQPAAPVASSMTPALEARLNALTTEIDALKKTMDQTAQQATQLAGKMDAQTSNASGNAALEERLARLETQIATLAAAKATKAAPAREADSALLSPAALDEQPVSSVSPPHAAKKTEHVKTKKTVEKHKLKKKAKDEKSEAKISWYLRAATPDSAWVSRTPGDPELRQVSVGEVLPGFGRVKAIRQKGDVWEIVGTQKTLR